jgi:hypothetical protein
MKLRRLRRRPWRRKRTRPRLMSAQLVIRPATNKAAEHPVIPIAHRVHLHFLKLSKHSSNCKRFLTFFQLNLLDTRVLRLSEPNVLLVVLDAEPYEYLARAEENV